MSVTSYLPPCKYRLDKLEKVLYLLDASIVKNIRIDNGEAYVDVDGDVAALQCHALELSDSASLDERYEFEHQLAFSVDGYFNELKDFDGYFAVKSIDGVYWLINPNIKCKVTYTYTLDGKSQQTDYAVATVSNFPVLRLHGVEGSTPVSCGYNHCIFQTLQLNDKRYAKKNGNVIKYTNAGGFRTINYNKNSANFIEEFDGNQVHHTLSFNINFDDYKSSWHINLLEFVNNKYVGIIKTQCGNVLVGFGNGLQARFEVSANDENGNPDSILIELNDVGTFLDYYDQIDFVYDSNTSWIFSYEHDGYECVSVNTAKYLLKKEIDAFGNETGQWMCLDGYEEMFQDLDIVDTFEETETFGNLNCGGQVCFLKGGLPSNLVITEQGYWHDSFIFSSDTNWNITTDSEYVSVTPNSGTGLVTYVLRVLNTKEPTNVPYHATLTLHFCDNKTIDYHVTVKKGLSCLQNDTYNINASRQYVTIPTRCCIMQINSGDLAITAQENDYFAVYVPQNNAGSAVTYNISVVFCDGHTENVTINQGIIYERWISEGYQCEDGYKCLVERKYTGLTPSNINAPTDETRTSDCALSNDCSGIITKWVDVIGAIQAICDHGVKYRLEEEMISYDGGQTWESNGKRRVGLPTEDSPAECANVEEWNIVLNQYWCEGTTKYTKEQLTLNGEPQNVYRKGSEIIASASTDCGYFVPPSGSHMLTEPRETDDYVCDGYSRYIKMRWWKSDDGGNTWTATDIYSKGALLEQFSNACGYGGDAQTRWRAYTAETMCIDTDLYYMYIKEESTDGGQTWHVAIPTTLSIDGEGTEPLNLAESASTECGYEPVIEPIYEWREVDGEYICDTCETPTYETQYLTFRAREAGTFSFSNAMSYSLDSGTTWTTLEGGASTPTIQSGETVMWKGNSRPYEGGGIGHFSSTGEFDVEGNAMSLLYGDDFEGETNLTGKDYAFQLLFQYCEHLISAENLVLPATTLADYCYDGMFFACWNLSVVPELQATILTPYCYRGMFWACSGLTTAPELPAITLVEGCYYGMFGDCTSLNYVKCLATDISATDCTNIWLSNAASTGTFVKASGVSWPSGTSGIPQNWSVQDAT